MLMTTVNFDGNIRIHKTNNVINYDVTCEQKTIEVNNCVAESIAMTSLKYVSEIYELITSIKFQA